jgi:dTDP-4-dehydrorhamnose 3,5-epimerase
LNLPFCFTSFLFFDCSIYIPKGFAHGFCCLDKENIIYYGCTNYREKNHEIGIIWNDKDLKINWPIKKPIMSLKDKLNFSFKEYCENF